MSSHKQSIGSSVLAHIYVRAIYRAYFAGVVEDIRAFLDGKPVRVID